MPANIEAAQPLSPTPLHSSIVSLSVVLTKQQPFSIVTWIGNGSRDGQSD